MLILGRNARSVSQEYSECVPAKQNFILKN